jgi:DNA repair protein RadC
VRHVKPLLGANRTPSPEDVAVTREIVAAGKLLDIEVLDHLVIGHQRFVSLKERGLGFGP